MGCPDGACLSVRPADLRGIANCSYLYYRFNVATISLKLPKPLLLDLEAEARRRGLPKSVLVRDALEASLRRKRSRKRTNCLDLIRDLAASQPGPRDASTNARYLREALLTDHSRGRKNSR